MTKPERARHARASVAVIFHVNRSCARAGRACRSPRVAPVKLNEAYRELEDVTPLWLTRFLRRLRKPELKPIRLVAGTLLIAGSFLAFLPILGLEMFPLGLLLLAEDIPFLRQPAGHLILWLVRQWKRFRAWWKPKIARLMARWGR